MRIHQLAEEAKVTNRIMLETVRRMGIDVKNHMSKLGGDDLAFVRTELWPETTSTTAEPAPPAPTSSWLQVEDEQFDGITLRRRTELDYRHFQKEAIAFMTRQKSTLLADEMGLGKTIEAIGVINATDPERVLIVCPAFLRLNWKHELERWLIRFKDRPIELVDDKTYYKLRAKDSYIGIVSYTSLDKYHNVLSEIPWDVVIGDEAHKIKNPDSLQSRAFRKIKADRRILMTGTPILNRVSELWPMLDWLNPGQWDAGQETFASRWSHPEGMDHLNRLLTDRIMLRRRKREVLKELPPKQRQVIEFPLDGILERAVKEEMRQCEALEARRLALEQAVEDAQLLKTDAEYRQALTNLREWRIQRRAALSKIRHATARSKEPFVTRQIKLLLENEGKVICFAYHRDIVERIAKHFGKSAVFMHGETSMKERDRLVRQFQTDPETRLFVGGIGSSGQGITLTAASTVVFAELDWTPANLTQCEDRAHRIGQDADSVLCQYLVADGSIDARLATYLVLKQDIIDRTIDGDRVEIEDDLIDRVVWASVAKRPANEYQGETQSKPAAKPTEPSTVVSPAVPNPMPDVFWTQRSCHVVGSVIAYWKLGYPVESATAADVPYSDSIKTVTPIKDWVVSRKIDTTSNGIPDAAVCHLATAILAGQVAEEMLFGEADSSYTRDDNTFLDAMLAASGMPPDEARQWLAWREAVARRLLSESENILKALSIALVAAPTIDRKLIDTLLDETPDEEDESAIFKIENH